MEERICVPSAVSVPQKMMFRCDKPCSEKSLSYRQLASVVIYEGESYTTNVCQKTIVQWTQVVEYKAHRGRIWRMVGKEPYVRGMWEYFLHERNRVKRFREQAEKSRQEHKVSGSWNRQLVNTWSK